MGILWLSVPGMAVRAEMNTHAGADGLIMGLAFSQSPLAQAIHDKDLLFLAVNDRMGQILGVSADRLMGRRLTDVVSGAQYDAMERVMRQVLESGEPARWETSGRDAGVRAWSVEVSPLRQPGGEMRAVWVGVLDVTGQHGARQRLMLLN
jgi:PAS domain S-box-containing protein